MSSNKWIQMRKFLMAAMRHSQAATRSIRSHVHKSAMRRMIWTRVCKSRSRCLHCIVHSATLIPLQGEPSVLQAGSTAQAWHSNHEHHAGFDANQQWKSKSSS